MRRWRWPPKPHLHARTDSAAMAQVLSLSVLARAVLAVLASLMAMLVENNGSAGGATAFGSLVTAYGGGGGEKGGVVAVNVGGAGGAFPAAQQHIQVLWAQQGRNHNSRHYSCLWMCAGGAGCNNYGFSYAGGYAHFGGQSGASGGGADNTNVS